MTQWQWRFPAGTSMMRILIFILVIVSINRSLCAQLPEARAVEKSVQLAIEKAEPAIVAVIVSRAASPPSIQEMAVPSYAAEYFGSGVVIDHRLVLTCYHVVRDATAIGVRIAPAKGDAGEQSSSLQRATIYAADSRTDLAVLRLDDPRADVASLELGKGEALKKGSFVIAMSQLPPGKKPTSGAAVSSGIVSNLLIRSPGNPQQEERIKSRKQFGTLMQVEARVRPGGSGGAVLDLDGKLAGILTTQFALNDDFTGDYAVVCDAGIRRVIDVLRRGEEVEYGFLGVAWVDPEVSGVRRGVMLANVVPGSPGAMAGLHSGDVVVSVDGDPVVNVNDMIARIGMCLADRNAVLEIQRPNRAGLNKVTVRLGKMDHKDFGVATNRPVPIHGLRVDYVSVLSNQRNSRNFESVPSGVVVREVQKGSPAEASGLREYVDVIYAVNGVKTLHPGDFYRESKKALDAGRAIRLELANRDDVVTLK